MDGKGSRGLSSGNDRQRQLQVLKIGKQCAKFLATHKQALFAGILLAGLVVLLFGVFSQFQGPSNNTAPSGMTAVDYSTFIAQVKAGNVLAVSFRDNEGNGVLWESLQKSQTAGVPPPNITPNQPPAGCSSVWPFLRHRRDF